MTLWLDTLQECAFEGVRFPIDSLETDGGNDVVEHVAYRRRGADVEFTGQKAYRGSFTVVLVNTASLTSVYGDLATGLRFDLLNLFESKPIGRLQHPTFGLLDAAITGWSERIDPATRNGSRLTVQWVEHNATASLLLGPDGATNSDTTASVEDISRDADAKASDANLVGYTPTQPTITAQKNYLEAGARTYAQATEALRQMDAVVAGNLALPSMVGTSANATTRALIRLRAAVASLREAYVPGAAAVRYFTVPQGMSAADVAQLVYGDSRRARDLVRANGLPDPLAIPAGRVITVMP